MKKLTEKECANLIGGWDFTLKIFGWEILEHVGNRIEKGISGIGGLNKSK
jgi:hypothetical protein